jgi:hypothetical protein
MNSEIPGFGCPEVVFLLIEFPLRQQKSLCHLLSAVFIFFDTLHTHLSFYLEVKFQFSPLMAKNNMLTCI